MISHMRIISYAMCFTELSVTERVSEREMYYANSERVWGVRVRWQDE
jgi:hypothetical protein